MTHLVRNSSQFKLLMAAVLALVLVIPKPAEANNGRLYVSLGVALVLLITGGAVWHNSGSSPDDPEFADDGDSQEHTLQLPLITYKKEAELKAHQHPSDIRLAPFVDAKNKIVEYKGTRTQLRAKTETAICEPITRVKGIDGTLLKDIHDQCHQWFLKNRMIFPHEFSGIDLHKAVNVVLPELIYSANKLTLMPFQATLKSSIESKETPDMSYYQISLKGFEASEFFKTCYHYPKAPGMIPPMVDAKGRLVYQLPKQGVTHLHHDGHKEFFIATDISSNQTKAYFWKLGAPWPAPPKPVYLSAAEGEPQPVHVPTHE
ncbi:hypothetical protein [Endozoicomonas arenosclerae]|uniref:hypothetical protein n=1 Tax=Endozoicomonas arenosclerae TaxID=1633495 RepID=UPI0007818A52|nr:hypothetical protein [Endozoicomonas arenosclerae]